jgi:hypothetical protein
MIDNLDGDFAGFGGIEGAADGGIEGGPGGFVDLSLEGSLDLFELFFTVREISMADEETFAVIIRIDKPAGDILGGIAASWSRS